MFSKVLTNTDIEKSLLIPTCSFNVLPVEEGRFFYVNVMDKAGKDWTFPCFIQQSEGSESSAVSVGWLRFLSDKAVRVGDMVCLHQKSLDNCTSLKIEVKRKIRLLGQDIWAVVD